MQVILREDVDNLGKIGDLVKVKPGYARDANLVREIAKMDLDAMTPLEAMNKLAELKKKAMESQ